MVSGRSTFACHLNTWRLTGQSHWNAELSINSLVVALQEWVTLTVSWTAVLFGCLQQTAWAWPACPATPRSVPRLTPGSCFLHVLALWKSVFNILNPHVQARRSSNCWCWTQVSACPFSREQSSQCCYWWTELVLFWLVFLHCRISTLSMPRRSSQEIKSVLVECLLKDFLCQMEAFMCLQCTSASDWWHFGILGHL